MRDVGRRVVLNIALQRVTTGTSRSSHSAGLCCLLLWLCGRWPLGPRDGWMASDLWMLVLSTPLAVILLVSYLMWRGGVNHVDSPIAWFGLLYQIVVSQFAGFAFYYRGLALGGVTKMSQAQQFQSVLAVLAAGIILAERIDVQLWIVLGLLMIAVVASRLSLLAANVNERQRTRMNTNE
jgi:drug/metabolite transporter (DMT)-like permease